MRLSLAIETRLMVTTKLVVATVLRPHATCSRCGRFLCEDEIRRGWTDDPRDFSTRCPGCGTRFNAVLVATRRDGTEEHFSYMCPVQLFHALETICNENAVECPLTTTAPEPGTQPASRKRLRMQELHDISPDVFWNLIKHHGSFTKGMVAFRIWRLKNPLHARAAG